MPKTKERPVGAHCETCKGPIYVGEECYDIGLVHVITPEGARTQVGYTHIDGRCAK